MIDDMSHGLLPFGHALRAKRLERKISLREFAKLVGISPTYLSQVEQCNVMPPTADRIKRMAEILDVSPDEWLALAGRISDDISKIISEHATELPDLLRALRGFTPEQIRKLRDVAERMKGRSYHGDKNIYGAPAHASPSQVRPRFTNEPRKRRGRSARKKSSKTIAKLNWPPSHYSFSPQTIMS